MSICYEDCLVGVGRMVFKWGRNIEMVVIEGGCRDLKVIFYGDEGVMGGVFLDVL